MHSFRMRTAHLSTVPASVATRCQYNGGPEVNMFEQVSSDAQEVGWWGGGGCTANSNVSWVMVT